MRDESKVIELNICYHPSPYTHAMRNDLVEMAEVCDGLHVVAGESVIAQAPRMISKCIEIAHDLNLVTLLVMGEYGNLFETQEAPSLYAAIHPESHCVTNKGRLVPKSCLNKPFVRAFLRDTVTRLSSEFEVDGFVFNKPTWNLPRHLGTLDADEWLCRCPQCIALFESQFQVPMPDVLTEEVKQFKTQTFVECLTDVCEQVKVCGNHLVTDLRLESQDVSLLRKADLEHLDVLGTDICWRPDSELSQKQLVEQSVATVTSVGNQKGVLSEAWICTWGLEANHEADVYRAAKYAAAQNVDCLNAWSYRDAFSLTPVAVARPADPDLVWAHLRRAYHEIRNDNYEIYDQG